jgi:hypothetical protein
MNTGKAAAGGSPASTWARLIRRIFEGDRTQMQWYMRSRLFRGPLSVERALQRPQTQKAGTLDGTLLSGSRAVIRKGRKPGGRVVRTHGNPLANLLLHKGKKLPNEARRHGQRENPGLS